MKVPYDGKVNFRLVAKRFKNKVFYDVDGSKCGKYELKPCHISKKSFNSLACVEYLESDKFGISQYVSWEDLFEIYEEAEKELIERNKLYNSFRYEPYLNLIIIKQYFEDLKAIERDITKLLKGFENFQGIDFCDVSAGGIQIRGHHKEIKGYTYGDQPTIKYDFSNKDSIVMEFVKMWYEHDTPSKVSYQKRFIADGEKHGWD